MQFRPTRRSLIKLLGAAGAASVARLGGLVPELRVFSAAPHPTSPTGPLKREWDGLKLSGATLLADEEMESVNAAFLGRSDVTQVASAHGLQLGHTRQVVAHNVESGGRLTAASWQLPSNQVLYFWGLDQPTDGILTQARLYQISEDGRATLISLSVNGTLAHREQPATQPGPPGVVQAAASGCSGCGWGGWGTKPFFTCCSFDLKCVASCCLPCVFGCRDHWSCAGCFGICCPLCIFYLGNCCLSWCTQCIQCSWLHG